MPRRNVLIIFFVAVMTLLCYQRVEHNPYARYLAFAFSQIDEQALERIPNDQLFEGAMNGLISKLNEHIDENSSFISSKEAEQFRNGLEQEFGGVGVTIGMKPLEDDPKGPKRLMVINPPWPETPAIKAGIRVHDEITAIDGHPTRDLTMNDVVKLMRGKVGEHVRLDVLHRGEEKPIAMDIERDVIVVPSVMGDVPLANGKWDFRLAADPRIGYVRLTTFGEKTVRELKNALTEMRDKNVAGLVIDLRDNTGGRLDAAVDISEMFLKKGSRIVSIEGRDPDLNEKYDTTSDGPYSDWPLAVLINGDSASASEIVAACLQDNHRAVVIGTRSYGKGTVQHLIPMEAGKSLLKLTAAMYLRPSGKNIHRAPGTKETDVWGVLPDAGFDIPLAKEQLERRYIERSRRDLVEPPPAIPEGAPPDPDDQGPADPQLQKAMEVLEKEIGTQPPVIKAA
jgi:carboxyl-terminal processing protease